MRKRSREFGVAERDTHHPDASDEPCEDSCWADPLAGKRGIEEHRGPNHSSNAKQQEITETHRPREIVTAFRSVCHYVASAAELINRNERQSYRSGSTLLPSDL